MSKQGTVPSGIRLHARSRELELTYPEGQSYRLACEYLRVYSPSAEVKGHGKGQEKTVPGKRDVKITNVEPVGNYAARITFSDGHSTGLYSWQYLAELGREHETIWQAYLDKLEAEGLSRS